MIVSPSEVFCCIAMDAWVFAGPEATTSKAGKLAEEFPAVLPVIFPAIVPPASGKKVPVPGVLADTQSTPLPVETKTSPEPP